MFLIIAGGGYIGYHLAEAELKKGNEVAIIEKNKDRVKWVCEHLGNLVVEGDANDPSTLEEAGITRAEVFIACLGKDEDNLIACQIARKKYRVPNIIAIVRSSSNREIFKSLGVDMTVCICDALVDKIQSFVKRMDNLVNIVFDKENYVMAKVVLNSDSPMVGMPTEDVPLPDEVFIVAVFRDGKFLHDLKIPLQAEDIVFITAPSERMKKVRELL